MGSYYFEDFEAGQQFEAGSHTMTKDDIIAFARAFDPQPQHTDEEAAKHSQFGELVASGWHTGGVSVRLKLQTPLGQVEGGLAGLGLEGIHFFQPVKPGDTLRVRVSILEKRLSASRPTQGILRYKVETLNQHNAVVAETTAAVLVKRRMS